MITELRTLSINERSKIEYHIKKGTIKTFKNEHNKVCCYTDDINNISILIADNKTIPTERIKYNSSEYKKLKLVRLIYLTRKEYNFINNNKTALIKGNAVRYIDELSYISIDFNKCMNIINKDKKPKRTTEYIREYNRLKQQEHRAKKAVIDSQAITI